MWMFRVQLSCLDIADWKNLFYRPVSVCRLAFILLRLRCCGWYGISGRSASMAVCIASFDSVLMTGDVCGCVRSRSGSLMSNPLSKSILLRFPLSSVEV